MPKGGYRAGAGRKRGCAEIRTRRIANELAREGLTPLEVMITTMRELWQQAQTASRPAERLEKRLAACAVAEKAAPYIHPRLGAVAATVRQVASVRDLSDAELAALIRSLGGDVIDGQSQPLALPAGKHDLN
jgi:hypothetical protein